MQVGDKVATTKMPADSHYKQVVGTVEYVRNGFVGIRAALVLSKWDDALRAHPTACTTAARVEHVIPCDY